MNNENTACSPTTEEIPKKKKTRKKNLNFICQMRKIRGKKLKQTLKMSREIFKGDENYCAFCAENEYVTKNNSVKLTAEILYRYLTNDISFIESHTGLEDVEIETVILLECIKRNPKVDGLLW